MTYGLRWLVVARRAGRRTSEAALTSASAVNRFVMSSPAGAHLKSVGVWIAWAFKPLMRLLGELMPKGLYARALIIIIAPIVLLEGVVAYVFMERHWQAVTRRLSEATARDIGAVISLFEAYQRKDKYAALVTLAGDRLNLSLTVLPAGKLPVARPRPFFDLLDRTLSNEIARHTKYPFWIDTVGNSRSVEIKVKHPKAVLRFVARRSQTYASNSHIFLVWMVVTSVILLCVAILFLRNQIRPILRLAEAADAFGKGRTAQLDITPRGAREVRQAYEAFLEMRDRIRQHVDQRTTMLAGVSHDLRTILTRFKLELALQGDSEEVRAMQSDVNEMQHMLEDYLAFARGDEGEEVELTGVNELIEEIIEDAQVFARSISFQIRPADVKLQVPVKRQAFKRAMTNLLSNAARFGDKVRVNAFRRRGWLHIDVEDNGPGISAGEREAVFRPFYRIDHARNQAKGHSGLGLAITRDIARSHGGDVVLDQSSLGGLKASIKLPL